MSWIYSQALAVAYSATKSTGGEPSAPSSVTHTHKPCLSRDKTTDRLSPSRYGPTCERLTADRGAELLTVYLAAFPVRIFPLREHAKESTAIDLDSGGSLPASFAKFCPDSCLWKTPQLSLLADSIACSVTWPRAGMMLRGACWERPTWAPRISAIACGLSGDGLTTANKQQTAPAIAMLPTPTCQDASNNGGPSQSDRNSLPLNAVVGGPLNPPWIEWLMGWPIGWTDCTPLETDKFHLWQVSCSMPY